MKETYLTVRKLKGVGGSAGAPIEHTVFIQGGTLKKIFSEIPEEELQTNANYGMLWLKPSLAVVRTCLTDKMYFGACCKQNSKNPEWLYGIIMDSNDTWSKKTIEMAYDVLNNKFFSSQPNSAANYYMVLLYEFINGNKPLIKKWFSLDFSLAEDEHHKDVFFEKNQEKNFDEVSSALFYYASKFIKSGAEVYETSVGDIPNQMIKDGMDILDYTAWFGRNKRISNETSIAKKCSSIIHIDIPEFEKPKQKKQSAEDFLNQNWELMTDEEAKILPPFLKMERDRCRKKYEANKSTLTKKMCTCIRQIYNKDITAFSFSGPAGSGKTTCAEIIAGCLHLPFQLVVGKAGVDTSAYLGYESIVSENGASVTKWHDGPITQAVRYGALLLFDEVNLAAPEIVGTLNTLLDDSKALVLDSGEVVKASPHFVYIESMNRGAGYAGTEDTNMSHDNRLKQVRFGLMDSEKEVNILERNTGYANVPILRKLVRIEREIGKMIEDPSSQIITIRDIERWILEAKYSGEWIDSAIDTVITSLCLKDESYDEITEQSIVQNEGVALNAFELIKNELEDETY